MSIPYLLHIYVVVLFLLPDILFALHPQTSTNVLLTYITAQVNLGDSVGTTIAIGDFNTDCYTDLLVVPPSSRMRVVQILLWHHTNFSFQTVSTKGFSLDQIAGLSNEAEIASVVTLDADMDGNLDVLLYIRCDGGYVGAVLEGNGNGGLKLLSLLNGVTPGMLVLDANEDSKPDIFHVEKDGTRVFCLNQGDFTFVRSIWDVQGEMASCKATAPFNSNAYVDLNGDCLPDLVITSSCGMEVWLNYGLANRYGNCTVCSVSMV